MVVVPVGAVPRSVGTSDEKLPFSAAVPGPAGPLEFTVKISRTWLVPASTKYNVLVAPAPPFVIQLPLKVNAGVVVGVTVTLPLELNTVPLTMKPNSKSAHDIVIVPFGFESLIATLAACEIAEIDSIARLAISALCVSFI